MIMGTEGSEQRRSCRHGGACLRRAMFSTGNASPESAAPPPRCLSAWSGVQATLPPLPICTSSAAADRVPQEHRPTREAGVVGGREKSTPSGSEHGSKVASTVVASGVGQIAQTNDHVQSAGDRSINQTAGQSPLDCNTGTSARLFCGPPAGSHRPAGRRFTAGRKWRQAFFSCVRAR